MRLGEITGLRWTQIDFLADEIKLFAGETKNDEGRPIPMIPQLKTALLAARKWNKTQFVCATKDGERLKSFRKAWASACKRAGLPGLRFHDLRRSAVRNLDRAGVSQKTGMEIIGHKTNSMYLRYNIGDYKAMKEAGAKLSEYVKNAENIHNSFTNAETSEAREQNKSRKIN